MTKAALEKKAEEYIKKNMLECIQEQIEYFEFAKRSYIARSDINIKDLIIKHINEG